MSERTLNINEGLYVLKKRFKLIIMCVLICTLFAGVYATFKMYPIYTASVKIFAGKDEQIQGDYSSSELNSYTTLINSYIEIIKTDDFMNKVIKKGNLNMNLLKLYNYLIRYCYNPLEFAHLFQQIF